ncbi:hypothetical protein [Streptomyces enissocaesilis]|uniref:hypothetical protein n=1 Tax=Streptomyces enissocaesilis TaxID=332589 RepID=UPI0031D3D8E8
MSTPVIAGTVDAWAEATAAGATAPGEPMLVDGTTMFLVNVLTEPAPGAPLWCTHGAFPGTYCLAGGMATSGAVTGWLREVTRVRGTARPRGHGGGERRAPPRGRPPGELPPPAGTLPGS